MPNKYSVKYTDSNKNPIEIQEGHINQDLDVTLFGRLRLAYGRDLNENFLHVLEKFACPADDPTLPINQQVPDLDSSINEDRPDPKLSNPVQGQIWVNTSIIAVDGEVDGEGTPLEQIGTPYVYNGSNWRPLSRAGSRVAANWGQILHGETLPNPVSQDGYVFRYNECSWIVGPFNHPEAVGSMVCRTTDLDPTVDIRYTFTNDPTIVGGVANYLIVGIKDDD